MADALRPDRVITGWHSSRLPLLRFIPAGPATFVWRRWVAGQAHPIGVHCFGSRAQEEQEENMARTLSRIVFTVSVMLIGSLNARAQEHCSTAHFRGVFGALAQGDLIFVPPGSGIPTGPTARVARVDVD